MSAFVERRCGVSCRETVH